MPKRSPHKDKGEEEPSQPSKNERPDKLDISEKTEPESESREPLHGEHPSPLEEEDSEQAAQTSRITILEEREIPFIEEKPPNFSPNFQVRIHRVQRRGKLRKEKE